MSPGETTTPPRATGAPMRPGPFLCGSAGGEPAGEDGEAEGLDDVAVAEASVDDGLPKGERLLLAPGCSDFSCKRIDDEGVVLRGDAERRA